MLKMRIGNFSRFFHLWRLNDENSPILPISTGNGDTASHDDESESRISSLAAARFVPMPCQRDLLLLLLPRKGHLCSSSILAAVAK
jgi:hypothetical protein